MEAINYHSSVIVCGETGCGKTTQVPQVGDLFLDECWCRIQLFSCRIFLDIMFLRFCFSFCMKRALVLTVLLLGLVLLV